MRAVRGLALLAIAALPAAAPAQRIDGRVVDAGTRSPIAAATFRLMRGEVEIATTISDSAGRFQLVAPDLGRYHLLASHVGYADARTPPIELNTVGTFTAELAMTVDAVEVAEITVNVPRSRYLETRGFYERMETGAGDYRTAEQVRRRNTQSLVDLLRGMRGVKVQRFNWKSEVYIAGATCLPQFVVDGVTVRYGGKEVQAGALSLDDLVHVSHIEGIEVYRGSSVPMEFEGPNASCGVIVVWTRVR